MFLALAGWGWGSGALLTGGGQYLLEPNTDNFFVQQNVLLIQEINFSRKFVNRTGTREPTGLEPEPAELDTEPEAAKQELEQIKKMDTDQDGTVTLEEFNANTTSRFQLMDKNSDGNISEDEYLATINKRFERMDLNSDGILQRKELRKALKSKKSKNGKMKEKKQPKPFIKQ